MSKARDLANLISQGNPLSDGAISVSEISDLTASAAELNKLDGVTATTAELNQVVGATSALQTQLDNISVTSGSLTKTFTQNETADITLSQSITSAPVVSATKEVPQSGVSTKGNWDVNSTASNYDFHDTAANVTLTPSTVQVANVSLASYANKASGSLGFTGLRGVWFKPDGTKMFTMDRPNAQIVQQNLSTAWDVSTQSNSGSYFQFTSGITTSNQPYGLWFNSDGTKLFVNNLNDVHGFTLSTAWDLSTISLVASNTVPTTAYDNETRNIFFKPDGTRLYIVGTQTDRVYEYTLPTAFDLSSIVNDAASRQLSVQAQANSPRHIYFNSTGTTFYIVDDTGSIYEYSLTTAWDISTASYTNNSFDTSSQGSGAQAMFLGNGNMYVVNDSTNQAYQYNFSQAGLVLGSGSFASTDVGKRIVGNGGDVILTSTGGAYSTTGGSAFTDNSTIAAGSWSMFGLKSAGDADGITISGISSLTPLNLANGSYDNKSFSVSQATSQDGVFLKSDGTRMYVLTTSGSGGNRVWQYDLSTAWDVSTASYNNASVDINTRSTNAGGIFFKPDGLKMYITDRSNTELDEWTLSTAWDVSTASFNNSKDLSTFNANPNGVFFKPDGTKMYTGDPNSERVREASLSTAWDITTITYDQSYNITSQELDIHDVEFTSDGTKMFIVGRGSDKIHEYDLSTAWDISTATYNNVYLDVSSQGAQPNGMHLKADDETKFYVVNSSTNAVYQYSTGATQTFVQPTQQYNVAVTNSGGRIDSQYFTDINSMTAAESAGTGTAHYAVSTDGRTTWSVAKGTDGVRPIVRNNSGTWQYNNASTYTGTTWVNGSTNNEFYTLQQSLGSGIAEAQTSFGGLGSVTYDTKTFSVASQDTDPRGVSFNNDGTKMFVAGNSGDDIYQYTLSTANDISTATYNSNFAAQGTNVLDVIFNNDGTKMYVPSSQPSPSRVYEYNLSTAFDLSTASYNSVSLSLSGQSNSSCHGISFNNNGTKLYAAISSSNLYEYALSTAYDLSTASYNNATFNASGQVSDISGVTFNTDGTKMFISDNGTDKVFQYSLSTAFDLSTASYDSVQLSITVDTDVEGVRFSPDFSKMYIVGAQNNTIYQYSTGVTTTQLNRMDKTQLDAVADANHFTLGNSLDLMIALRMDTAASTLPTSDGVTLNYDAAALNEGAVLGTDYDFFFPANNKVQIKSLAAQNLKVRVV